MVGRIRFAKILQGLVNIREVDLIFYAQGYLDDAST